MVILSGLIIFKYVYEEIITFESYYKYHHDEGYMNNISMFDGHSFDDPDVFIQNTHIIISSYLDFFIYCMIPFIAIWESLFSFYRYYTTLSSSKYFYSLSLRAVFKPFSVNIVIFLILFVVQTQFYYWLFPIVFLYYFTTNIYWIYNVAYLLLKSYARLTGKYTFNCFTFNTYSKLNRFDFTVINLLLLM